MPTPMQAAIMSSGSAAAYVDMWFAANTYRVAGVTSGDLPLVTGFTFTGASLRTMFDSTGAMTYGPNNLLLQSQTFGAAPWSLTRASITSDAAVAPDGTMTADKLVEDTATDNHRITQSVTAPIGQSIYSIYLKAAERAWALIEVISGATDLYTYVNLSTGALGTGNAAYTVTNAGNGWWRVSMVLPCLSTTTNCYVFPATANNVSSYTGDGTSGIYLWGAQLEAVTYRTTPAAYMPTTSAAYYGPRLVYDPVTLASLGILVEEARTNLMLQSQTLDNASWTKDDSSITADATTSPDGTSNADKVVEAATTANHRVIQTVTVSNATVYTYSIYVKAAERTWAFFEVISGATDLYCYLNLATGALGTTNTTPTVTSVGNGWYRVVITFTSATTSATAYNHITTGNGTTSYAGDGTSGAYFWQAQLEAGEGASSAIVTTSAAVTRAADDARVTGISLAGAFTFVTTANRPAGFTGAAGSAVVGDGTASNRVTNYANDPTTLRVFANVGGPGSGVTSGTTSAGATYSQASSFDGVTTVKTSGAGAAVGSVTVAVNPASLTRISLGTTTGDGQQLLNGTVSRVRLYRSALSDAQLQALTA